MHPATLITPAECPAPDEIQAYADGRDDARALEGHLDACAECRAVVALLKGTGYFAERDIGVTGTEAVGEVACPLQQRFGRYQLLAPLGAGGMGRVFRAHDPQLSRDVALKRVRAGAMRHGELQRRLLREAQAMAKVRHPAVVGVLDVGSEGDELFVAMELVDGVTLREWLDTRPPLDAVLRVLAEAAEGLAAAHRANLVHRDFKPDNVMVTRDGHARVTDFGLACSAWERDAEPLAGTAPANDDTDLDEDLTELTATGHVLGTPRYMAPEQFLGQAATPQADQFAFWVSLHEAIWGTDPFPGRTRGERRAAVLAGVRVARPRLPVPEWLEAAVEKGLAFDPAARHPSMDSVAALLSRDVVAEARAAALKRRLQLRAVAAGAFGALLALALSFSSAVSALEERAQGMLLARAARPWPEQVVVVSQDQATVDALGWPPPRATLARVVEAVWAAQAKVVVWDGFFHLPAIDGPQGDAAFARALAKGPSVLAAPCTLVAGEEPGPPEPGGRLDCARMIQPVEALRAAAQVGHVEVLRSSAGTVRGTYALARTKGHDVPSLALSAWMLAEGYRVLRAVPGGLDTTGGFVPTDDAGGVWVSHRLPWEDSVVSMRALTDALSARDSLPPELAERLRGRYVLFGQTAETLHDTAPFASGVRLPLVLLHGMLLGDLLEGRVLRAVPRVFDVLAALLFALLAIAAAVVLRPLPALLGLAAITCGAWGGALLLLREGWVGAPVAVTAAAVLAFAAASAARRLE